MLTKWYIGVNAKSKGFFKGFLGYRNDSIESKPTFTKQSALANGFESEDKAKDYINKQYITPCKMGLAKAIDTIDAINKTKPIYNTLTDDAKLAFLAEHDINPSYNSVNHWGNHSHQVLYVSHIINRGRTLKADELTALHNVEWDKEIEKKETSKKRNQNRIDFLESKLVFREVEMEFKFMDKERRKVQWHQRGDDATSSGYCNCCGGAIPGIPQLVIGTGWSKETCTICAICMGRLAEEAKIQSGKISDEVLDHYQTDRFLRAMD